jgi:RNA polymerase sigma-70 factor (ECF subfamily)
LTRRLKRQRIVPFEAIAEIDAFVDDKPSPERQVAGKIAYARILDMIELLPERCRQVMRLRKIEGWTQRAIAEHLGVTEKAIEKQIWTGVRMIREAWSRGSRTRKIGLIIRNDAEESNDAPAGQQ